MDFGWPVEELGFVFHLNLPVNLDAFTKVTRLRSRGSAFCLLITVPLPPRPQPVQNETLQNAGHQELISHFVMTRELNDMQKRYYLHFM
jgi:hypothetical protein